MFSKTNFFPKTVIGLGFNEVFPDGGEPSRPSRQHRDAVACLNEVLPDEGEPSGPPCQAATVSNRLNEVLPDEGEPSHLPLERVVEASDCIQGNASTPVFRILATRREPRGFGAKVIVESAECKLNESRCQCFSVEQLIGKGALAPTEVVSTGVPLKGVRRAKWFRCSLMLNLLLHCSTHPLYAREVPTIRWEASGSHEDVW